MQPRSPFGYVRALASVGFVARQSPEAQSSQQRLTTNFAQAGAVIFSA